MMQEIITILIVAGATFVVVRNLYQQFRPRPSSDACNGCASSCGGCPVLDLKTQIKAGQEKEK